MREILFRGKEVESSDWYYGDIFHSSMNVDTTRIHDYINRANVEIIPDTLGQFTGLTDKNGVKIFEGDLVKGTAYSGKFVGVIVWIDEIGGFGVRYRKRQEATAWENSSILKCASKGRTDEFTAEIIGNIYDNPELIGGAGYENNI